MEKIISKETLSLTKTVFSTLLDKVIEHFKSTHNIKDNYKEAQLFGFGNYNPDLPNLKNDLELVLKGYVNGKYLYNKKREASTGISQIKISRDYKYLFFNYIGYKSIKEFIDHEEFTQIQRAKQLALLQNTIEEKDHFYEVYYIDEDLKMNGGILHITNQWKHFEIKFIYNEDEDDQIIREEFVFFGNIIKSESFVFFDSKYIVEGKKKEGAKITFYVGKSTPNDRVYLFGTYSGFDKFDNVISGKIILVKANSSVEAEKNIMAKYVNPIICQELYKHRLVIQSSIKKNPLIFSKKSPYAHAFEKLYGNYSMTFKLNKKEKNLNFEIEKFNLNIKSNDESIYIEKHYIDIMNKGQTINMDITFTGIFSLQKTSIYFRSVPLFEDNKVSGTYVGVDINNQVVSGDVYVKRITN